MIKNEDIKYILTNFHELIAVGSYSRDSHKESYKDADFLTLSNLNYIINEFKELFNNVVVLKKGEKHISLLVNNNKIDIWKTNKKDFYKDYLLRHLIKHQVINIHKYLSKNI